LLLWSFHSRGSNAQFLIKRYVDIEIFGNLLGQMQAEGTKKDFKKLEFANKSIQEHIDFVSYLNDLGILEGFVTDGIFHESIKEKDYEIIKFERLTKRKVRAKVITSKSKGGFAFKTYIRNALLTDLILFSMDFIRKNLIESTWNKNSIKLFESFFAKVLTGDGTIDIDNKDRNIPQARLSITDGNPKYLEDYALLMKKYGLNPIINYKWIYVRAFLNPYYIKKLKEIKAFKNNPNDEKLNYLLSFIDQPI